MDFPFFARDFSSALGRLSAMKDDAHNVPNGKIPDSHTALSDWKNIAKCNN